MTKTIPLTETEALSKKVDTYRAKQNSLEFARRNLQNAIDKEAAAIAELEETAQELHSLGIDTAA